MNATDLNLICPDCGAKIANNGHTTPSASDWLLLNYLRKMRRSGNESEGAVSFWWTTAWAARMALIALCVFVPSLVFLFWLWTLTLDQSINWVVLFCLGLSCLISTVAYLGVMVVRYYFFLPKCCNVQFKATISFPSSEHLSLYEQYCQWQRIHAPGLRNIIAAACFGSLFTLFTAIKLAFEDRTCYTGSGLFVEMWFLAAGAGFLLHHVNDEKVNPSISLSDFRESYGR